MDKPLFIIGYMACGKTTFAKALAQSINRDFIDLDFYIEQRFRSSINKIFSERGETEFRRMESAMLREVSEFENVIIACGGGTPCFNQNMDYMLETGCVVFLEASTERILQRLIINNSRRPLMAGKSEEEMRTTIIEGLNQRLQFYRRANISFSGEKLEDKEQIDNTICRFLELHKDDI